MEERLQKIMASAGVGSRRACDAMIAAGRVTVNGKVALPGTKADPERDQIAVDGELLKKPAPKVYIALHKPRGVLSTVETPDSRNTVRDLVPVAELVYPVGRLDFDSEGLILLTNDGELAEKLTHPRYGHEKEYRVLVAKQPDEEQLDAWRRGVVLADGFRTGPAQVTVETLAGKGAWLRVVMKEGHKRQIRETGNQTGLPVVRIIRLRIATLRLGSLKPGEWRYLTKSEVKTLKDSLKPQAAQKNKSFNTLQNRGEKNKPIGATKPHSISSTAPKTKPRIQPPSKKDSGSGSRK